MYSNTLSNISIIWFFVLYTDFYDKKELLSQYTPLKEIPYHYATLEGITHHTLGDISRDYSDHLQTLIRRDPEVILATDPAVGTGIGFPIGLKIGLVDDL